MSVAGDHAVLGLKRGNTASLASGIAVLGLTFLPKCDIIRGDRRFLWRG